MLAGKRMEEGWAEKKAQPGPVQGPENTFLVFHFLINFLKLKIVFIFIKIRKNCFKDSNYLQKSLSNMQNYI